MPTIFETLTPHAATDTVAVFDQSFSQVFPRARALKVVVKEDAKLMEHPVERGATTADHRIILPIEIELSFILQSPDYLDTYRAIKQYFLNATLLIVQTRSGTYQNQLISSMPHEEDPEQFDALAMAISLKQVQFVTPQFNVKPRKPSNSTVVDRGNLQPKPATGNPSYLAQIDNFIARKTS
jgi:Dit-like tail protein